MDFLTRNMRLPLLFLFVAVLGAPTLGSAQDQEEAETAQLREARARFELAEAQFDQGNYALAADSFREVYGMMDGHPRRYLVLFNLGRSLEETGAHQQAADAYARYLDEGGAASENAAEIRARIQEMERRASLARAPNSGEASPDDAVPPARAEDVPQPAEEQAAAGPQTADDSLLMGGVGAFGVAIGGFVTMGIFGGMALSADAQLADGCGATSTCTPEEVADADTFALISDIGLGVGVAGAVAGIVLLILGLAPSGSDSGASLSIRPTAGVRGGGLQLTGDL